MKWILTKPRLAAAGGIPARAERVFRVLIADDDPQTLKLLAHILASHGHQVITASSGADAAEIVETRRIDLLVLDLEMPKPDGFDILKSCRARKPKLPVLVVSGYLDGALLKASEMFGASASLSKSEAPQKIASVVRTLLL